MAMRIERRTLTVTEAVASVLSGEVVPDVYDIEADKPDGKCAREFIRFKLARKRRPRHSPLKSTGENQDSAPPATRPRDTPMLDWVHNALSKDEGVLAAASVSSKVLMLSKSVACGHPQYWLESMVDNADSFNHKKTRRSGSPNRTTFEANMLSSGVRDFMPEGNAYGLNVADMDAFLDPGMSVEIRKRPYGPDELISFADSERRFQCISKEAAMLLDAAKRGIAPCVIAMFYARRGVRSKWPEGPMHQVHEEGHERGDISALVTVSQINTFSLGDLMDAINSAPVVTKRDHLNNMLTNACGAVFSKIIDLVTPFKGSAMVKLNMTPSSIVFCPELTDSGGSWTLNGVGFMPVSKDYIDGVPKITDFNSVASIRVDERSTSTEVSFVMHCMLLVAYTRARHGAAVADVLWNFLLADEDPSGFLKASNAMQSKATNASSFLANLAASTDMREHPEMSKALSDLISDVDSLVREGVVSENGGLKQPKEKPLFNKLVSTITGLSQPDTNIFDRSTQTTHMDSQAAHIDALEAVKATRFLRLSSPQYHAM